MFEEHRFAARYAFVEELWRGRARILVDAALEQLLVSRPSWLHGREEHPLRELIDALLPTRGTPEESVWMGVSSAAVAAQLSRTRPGTTFVPLQGVTDVLRRAQWETALVHLGRTPEDAVDTEGDLTDRERIWLDQVAKLALEDGGDRVAIISANARAEAVVGWDYGDFEGLTIDGREHARLFGLYLPVMAAVVALQAAEDDDAEDVPLAYDNTLGTQEPELLEWIALWGREGAGVGEGLTLIELSASPTEAAADTARASSAQRGRSGALLERLEADAAALRQENEELRRTLERAASRERIALETKERHDLVLAREQTLRWQLSALEREVASLRGRPVDALQAEVAQLRAMAAQSNGQAVDHRNGDENRGVAADEAIREENGQSSFAARFADLDTGRGLHRLQLGDPHTLSLVSTVDGLVRRLERGGIGTLELRRELVSLRRRLVS